MKSISHTFGPEGTGGTGSKCTVKPGEEKSLMIFTFCWRSWKLGAGNNLHSEERRSRRVITIFQPCRWY